MYPLGGRGRGGMRSQDWRETKEEIKVGEEKEKEEV